MHFDGWKCYFKLEKPTLLDLIKYDIRKLTSSLPYEPHRRYSRRAKSKVNPDIGTWRERLRYPSLEVTKSTLARNTQMAQTLQVETREYMIDHCKIGVWVLRPKKIDDDVYSDTYFSSIVSVRGYICFQTFAYKNSIFENIELMRH